MTNEELAVALNQVRRLKEQIDACDTSTVNLDTLGNLKDSIGDLDDSVRSAINVAADEQSEFKGVEFVNFKGMLAMVVVTFYMDGKINHAVEYVAKDRRNTVGIPFKAEGLTAADPADFKWDKYTKRWRLKPSGKTNV